MKYLSVLLFTCVISLTACDDGSAENLGESIDDAARDAGNAVEDLCEDVTDRNC